MSSGGDAFAQLIAQVGWPNGKGTRELARWLGELVQVAERRGVPELAALAGAVVRDPDNPDGLYDLGFALIEAGVPRLAATVLWRCMELVGDSEQVVSELVSALELALANADAVALLAARDGLRAHSALCQYLYAFNAAMIGRLDLTRAELARLRAQLAERAPAGEHAAFEHGLAAILARADRVASVCPLDGGDLRGWQFVLTGALVAHQSPYGWPEPMHGRFAYLRDSIARVAMGIDRLGPLAAAAGATCVYTTPGIDHEIVARAVALRLGLPLVPWPAIGVPAPGIVALYDLDQLPPEVAVLAERRPGQVLFAHATPWTRYCPIAADVTTLLYEILEPPWAGDARPPEAIAADIAAVPSLGPEDLAADETARWAALVAAAWPPPDDRRSRAWAGGPVRSNRFG